MSSSILRTGSLKRSRSKTNNAVPAVEHVRSIPAKTVRARRPSWFIFVPFFAAFVYVVLYASIDRFPASQGLNLASRLENPAFEEEPLGTLVDLSTLKCEKDADKLMKLSERFRIYVYDDFPAAEPHMGNRDGCANGQFGTEIRLVRYFRSHPSVTRNPAKAHLFYVPMYPKCVRYHYEKERGMRNRLRLDPHLDRVLDEVYIGIVEDLRQNHSHSYNRADGRDHAWLFPSGRGATIFPSWRMYVNQSIFLSPEAGYSIKQKANAPYFLRDKDMVIPGYLQHFQDLQERKRDYRDRDLFIVYCGDFYKSAQRINISSLGALKEVKERQNVVISDKCATAKYSGKARFCLTPQGHSPWTLRFYEVMVTGCLPVVFGDRFLPAFADIIPYDDFVIRWPADQIDYSLVKHLSKMTDQEVKRRMKIMHEYVPLLLYDETADQSAFTLILRYLEHKFCTWTLPNIK